MTKMHFLASSACEPSASGQRAVEVSSRLLERARCFRNPSRHRYEMLVELPDEEKLIGSGSSPKEAFVDFCTQVSAFVFQDASQTGEYEALVKWLRTSPEARPARRFKARQKTIGVSSKASLVEAISNDTGPQEPVFAVAARTLFEKGFEELDSRLDRESSQAVFAEYQSAYRALPESPSQQWMLRLGQDVYERTLVLANEYQKSLSNLAAICITYALQPNHKTGEAAEER